MAEVKNTFLSSKMNLDLDDRLIPNGQYRQAFNIAVGRSEDEDIGALENIPGNVLLVGTDLRNTLGNPNIDCIGVIADDNNNNIILFLTDWDKDINNLAPANAFCAIYLYKLSSSGDSYFPLVTGSFLNFSKANPIYGVNLVEDLLFWTDNRNQPRKINTTTALDNFPYYINEVQISVAKYNPYETISLIKTVNTTIDNPAPFTTVFKVTNIVGIELGMTLLCKSKIEGSDYIFVTAIDKVNKIITIDSAPSSALANADKLVLLSSTMTNEDSNPIWPGDPDYMRSRYVRFGYRFKFDDSEYSITSPFTQIAYIPEQKGFFVAGDEDAAYRSTVLNFMQNNVQNVELLIPLPDKLNNIQNSYKITEIDILYKQADQTTIKVLDTIVVSEVDPVEGDVNLLTYNYQSRKPYKTLPEAQTVRVYDRVPTRAFAQETSGNRIIYGNYKDVYTPPKNINYTITVADKAMDYSSNFNSFIEYPNHTLKENRNYQVGFVLCDKYGRQSPVILSSVKDIKNGVDEIYGGSTVYSPYKTAANQPNLNNWVGDILQVLVNSPIESGNNGEPNFSTGEPGLYAIPTGTRNGFSINAGVVGVVGVLNPQNTYSFTRDSSIVNNDIPVVGSYLRGKYKDYVKVIPPITTGPTLDPTPTPPNYFVRADGPISDIYNYNSVNNPDIKFAYNINEIGWYSYKVVVKQTEQDYYNCYLPGMLNGYPVAIVDEPVFPTDENGVTAHIVLLNDNINKIPRDLSEVGPDQKQYRSSVVLYGRVQNTATSNIQYYPGRLFDVVSTIANATELNMDAAKLTPASQVNIYQVNTKPIIGRVSTSKTIGVTTTTMEPFLSVYETKPVESLLTIYWETSTNGLISDLNENVLTGYPGPYAFSEITYLQTEDKNPINIDGEDPQNKWVTNAFSVKSVEGGILSPITVNNFSVTSVRNSGADITSKFGYDKNEITEQISIFIKEPFTYVYDSSTKDMFTFSFTISYNDGSETFTNTLITTGSLTNINPSYSIDQVFNVERNVDLVGQVLGGVNGGFDIINKTTEIYWTLGTITGPSVLPVPFTINNNTGVISQTIDSLRAYGKYTLPITITDATLANGVKGTGFGQYDGSVEVSIGETPLNSGIPSAGNEVFCDIADYNLTPGRLVIAPAYALNNFSTAASWFVGDSDVSTTPLPSEWTTLVSAGKTLNTPHKMGSSLTKGAMGVTVNSQIKSPDYPIPSSGIFYFKVFYRANNAFPWVESFLDINNKDYSTYPQQFDVYRADYISTTTSITRAYDLPGEYFIMVYNISTISDNPQTYPYPITEDLMNIWVNVFDLFYTGEDLPCPSCVGSSEPSSWNYLISSASVSRDCASVPAVNMYTNTPYLQYARSFFKDADLLVPIDSPVWLSTTPDLYYTITQDFWDSNPYPQTALPEKATLIIDASGNKLQPGGTTDPYTQFCLNTYNGDYVITTKY